VRSIDFVNHTIVANNAGRNIVLGELGGGIALALLSSGIEIANNIIAFNSSGIWNHPTPLGTATLTANDVFSNGTSNYIGLTAGPTDISADPQFVKYSEGDLHLTSRSQGSPRSSIRSTATPTPKAATRWCASSSFPIATWSPWSGALPLCRRCRAGECERTPAANTLCVRCL
jgi:hypothetical protein